MSTACEQPSVAVEQDVRGSGGRKSQRRKIQQASGSQARTTKKRRNINNLSEATEQ